MSALDENGSVRRKSVSGSAALLISVIALLLSLSTFVVDKLPTVVMLNPAFLYQGTQSTSHIKFVLTLKNMGSIDAAHLNASVQYRFVQQDGAISWHVEPPSYPEATLKQGESFDIDSENLLPTTADCHVANATGEVQGKSCSVDPQILIASGNYQFSYFAGLLSSKRTFCFEFAGNHYMNVQNITNVMQCPRN